MKDSHFAIAGFRWHEQISNGILDRLVHNAHCIEMPVDWMRKNRGKGIANDAAQNTRSIIKPMTSGNLAERHLPDEILERASLRGNEYAWPVADISSVIEAICRSNLVNLGGQLQFRFPDGTTCECYWVEVDASRIVPESLPWAERVTQTAAVALRDFAALSSKYDFFEEGRRNFSVAFKEVEAQGYDPREAMCFVWYAAEPGV